MMDSLLRSSKFIDLKKSFSSIQNSRANNTQVSYGLRSVSRNNNSRKPSVYSKFSNRTYGNSEVVDNEKNNQPSHRIFTSYVPLRKIDEPITTKTNKFQVLNGSNSIFKGRDNLEESNRNIISTRDPVESSFRFHYSNASPIKSTHEINERSVNYRTQAQNMKVPSNISRVERDNDGFVIPNATAVHRPKPRIAEFNEEEEEEVERSTKWMLCDLIDNLSHVEAFYYLKRYEEWLLNEKRKKAQDVLNGYHGLDRDRSLQISDWIHSNPSEPIMRNRGWNREMVEDNVSVSSRNTMHRHLNPCQRYKEPDPPQVSVFLLQNWTIIKGSGPSDLMVSGDLRDIKNQTLIEEGHITSKILSADTTIIKTSCCVYHLIGEFIDTNNSIPDDIKKYFINGKFPKQWKEIVRKWNLIKQKRSMQYFSRESNIDVYGGRDETNLSINNRKRKSTSSPERQNQKGKKRHRSEQLDATHQTPLRRKSTNFSMITRSALRKRQSRSDYSFLETPKSSKAYKKLKSRIKTPMPRRGREDQVMSDNSDSY